jgi:hypothetical protein
MKTATYQWKYVWLGLVALLVACSEKPLQQTRNPAEASVETLWQIPDAHTDTAPLSAREVDRRTQMVDYEIEKLNRLIEYNANENVEEWEQQKALLRNYKKKLQAAAQPSSKQPKK